MLQGFHWDSTNRLPGTGSWWTVVKNNTPQIAQSGFDKVWLPPPGASASPQGYLPNRWLDFNTNYGTEKEQTDTLDSLNDAGLIPIADVVANHRVGDKDWADFSQPTLSPKAIVRNGTFRGAQGGPDTGAPFTPARDLDHNSNEVREAIPQWLNALQALGYGGIRWDYAKGFAAQRVGEYLDKAEIGTSVGEVWEDLDLNNPDANRKRIIDWIDGTGGRSAAFDFTTKGLLQHAVATGEYGKLRDQEGRPSGVVGWWPEKAVTFLDNHDTGPIPAGQGHWSFPSDKVAEGYAYLFAHGGTPTVFWPHFFDWGESLQTTIKGLMAARDSVGIEADSKTAILKAEKDLYVARTQGAGGELAVKLGSRGWDPGKDWTLAVSGQNFAVWKKPAS